MDADSHDLPDGALFGINRGKRNHFPPFDALYVVHDMKMFMPPAGALSILAMIIPENVVLFYPFQVFLGSLIIMTVSRLLFMRRQDKNAHELKIEYR